MGKIFVYLRVNTTKLYYGYGKTVSNDMAMARHTAHIPTVEEYLYGYYMR